jgi:hypothetical protein
LIDVGLSVVGDVTGIRPVLTTAVSLAIVVKFLGFICIASGFEVGSDLARFTDHSLCFPSVGQVLPVKQGQASALTSSGSCPSQKFELVIFPLGVGIFSPSYVITIIFILIMIIFMQIINIFFVDIGSLLQ